MCCCTADEIQPPSPSPLRLPRRPSPRGCSRMTPSRRRASAPGWHLSYVEQQQRRIRADDGRPQFGAKKRRGRGHFCKVAVVLLETSSRCLWVCLWQALSTALTTLLLNLAELPLPSQRATFIIHNPITGLKTNV
nr:uncharacterized protein LOC109752970 [Aegilops tauschii subsp. strangulata]